MNLTDQSASDRMPAYKLVGAGAYVDTDTTHWVEHLAVEDLSCGTYCIPAGGHDDQSPHTEDELYIVTAGRGTLWTPTAAIPMVAGDVAYVPAGMEHKFVNITENLAVVVVFGPAEFSRSSP